MAAVQEREIRIEGEPSKNLRHDWHKMLTFIGMSGEASSSQMQEVLYAAAGKVAARIVAIPIEERRLFFIGAFEALMERNLDLAYRVHTLMREVKAKQEKI